MEGLIKIAIGFTAVSLIAMLIYLRQNKKRRYSSLSLDFTSILVYILAISFFVMSYYYYFQN